MTSTTRTVAALYVLPDTIYARLDGVDCWPERRDARLYTGPHPIVAHPPCSAWSRLWAVRGTRSHPGDGDTCGLTAVAQVKKYGGVLEQPAASALWRAAYLPAPGLPDLWGGRSVLIHQCEWGHPATKPTWLYLVGCDNLPPPPHPGRRGKNLEMCSRRQKLATPPMLAQALVNLARSVA